MAGEWLQIRTVHLRPSLLIMDPVGRPHQWKQKQTMAYVIWNWALSEKGVLVLYGSFVLHTQRKSTQCGQAEAAYSEPAKERRQLPPPDFGRDSKAVSRAHKEENQEQEEEQSSESHLGKLPDDSASPLLCRDLQGDEHNPAPAGGHQHHGEPKEDASPVTSSPLPSPALLTQHPPPPDSHPSERPQQVQSDMKSTPAGPAPDSAPPGNSCLASLGTATKGLDRVSGSIAFFSWWWPTAKALLLFTSPHGRCRQEPLSQHPPEASPWGDAARGQAEAGGPPFINPDVQRLLEILISRRAELMLKAEEKTGSLLGQMRPGSLLSSLGALFWRPRHKCTQLQGPQRLSAPPVFGDHLEKKCSQLFWGLPSLHSESLVATAWVSKGPSLSRAPTVRFNVNSRSSPVQTQSSDPPLLSQSQPLPPNHLNQPQPLTEKLPIHLRQVPTPVQLPCSFPSLPSPSLHKGRTCRSSCPTSQDKARSIIPTDNQEMDWPLQMPLQRKWATRSFLQNPQEGAGQPTPSLPQGSWASQTRKSTSAFPGETISPELHRQSEQQSQARLLKDKPQDGFLYRIQPHQKLLHPRGKFSRTCPFQGMEKQGRSQPSLPSAGKSIKDVKTVEPMQCRRPHRKDAVGLKLDKQSEALGQDEDDKKDLSWIPESTSVKVLEDDKEEAERNFFKPRKHEDRSYKPRVPEKEDLKKDLKVHLEKKSGQIKKGRIPVRVRRSWLTANFAFPNDNTHMKPRNPADLKGHNSSVNTSQKTYFVNPFTRNLLETHIGRFPVRRGWNLYYQTLKHTNLNSGAVQVSQHPQPKFPSSASRESGANVKVKAANALGDPHKGLGEKMMAKKSVPPPERPVIAPSSVYKEAKKTLTVTPSGGTRRLSEAPGTRQEAKLPSESLKDSLLDRFQQSKTAQGARRGSLAWRKSTTTAKNEPQEIGHLAPPDHYKPETQISRVSQATGAKEIRGALEAEEKPLTWEATREANMMISQTINVNLSLEPLGDGQCPQTSRMPIGYRTGQPGLEREVVNEVEVQVEVESENQPQGQDTDIVYQDYTVEVHPVTDILASQASSDTPKSMSSSNISASQGLHDHLLKAGWSQRQQEPRSPKVRSPWKSENNMFSPSDKREDCRRLRPGDHEERAAGQRATHACGMSHPAWNRETGDTLVKKSSPFLPKRRQEPLESHNKKIIRPFMQHSTPTQRGSRFSGVSLCCALGCGKRVSVCVSECGFQKGQGDSVTAVPPSLQMPQDCLLGFH
ncbi:spermatogenesis-associated protein 31E1-like [Lepus europaeus]|uniref:spermatogenesis-associated protein 31E1-like n=1 Tax=Lepus europaeus TaxID=9983 RepID=UPI002B48F761|nr:spermatogenesis-associated protein 31E1-like [Lepus europaeus]